MLWSKLTYTFSLSDLILVCDAECFGFLSSNKGGLANSCNQKHSKKVAMWSVVIRIKEMTGSISISKYRKR